MATYREFALVLANATDKSLRTKHSKVVASAFDKAVRAFMFKPNAATWKALVGAESALSAVLLVVWE